MYDYQQISDLVEQAKKDDRPSLIMLKSEIGKGAPTVVGKSAAHGAPLGEDGVKAAKEFLGLPLDKDFYVVPEAYEYFASKKDEIAKKYEQKRNHNLPPFGRKSEYSHRTMSSRQAFRFG